MAFKGLKSFRMNQVMKLNVQHFHPNTHMLAHTCAMSLSLKGLKYNPVTHSTLFKSIL